MTTWIDIENIMLSKVSQTETTRNHMISLIWDIKLKATNERTRKTSKQELTDTDNSMSVTIEGEPWDSNR